MSTEPSGLRTSRWGTLTRRSTITRSAWRLQRTWAIGRERAGRMRTSGMHIIQRGAFGRRSSTTRRTWRLHRTWATGRGRAWRTGTSGMRTVGESWERVSVAGGLWPGDQVPHRAPDGFQIHRTYTGPVLTIERAVGGGQPYSTFYIYINDSMGPPTRCGPTCGVHSFHTATVDDLSVSRADARRLNDGPEWGRFSDHKNTVRRVPGVRSRPSLRPLSRSWCPSGCPYADYCWR